ncbi:hypothetical protein J2S44_002262 [Catenuloplanes niger]|uniref:Uncharacterized protein n=1 Tax=Catenuloplanes niger TaxID=587534 RepID=A0AAE3ZLH3_9ACTN|nr:hypothetical protein [Catenuloplanes niger]
MAVAGADFRRAAVTGSGLFLWRISHQVRQRWLPWAVRPAEWWLSLGGGSAEWRVPPGVGFWSDGEFRRVLGLAGGEFRRAVGSAGKTSSAGRWVLAGWPVSPGGGFSLGAPSSRGGIRWVRLPRRVISPAGGEFRDEEMLRPARDDAGTRVIRGRAPARRANLLGVGAGCAAMRQTRRVRQARRCGGCGGAAGAADTAVRRCGRHGRCGRCGGAAGAAVRQTRGCGRRGSAGVCERRGQPGAVVVLRVVAAGGRVGCAAM